MQYNTIGYTKMLVDVKLLDEQFTEIFDIICAIERENNEEDKEMLKKLEGLENFLSDVICALKKDGGATLKAINL